MVKPDFEESTNISKLHKIKDEKETDSYHMTCASNTKNYIERKLAGEDVISPGSLYGHMALSERPQSDAFLVLNIDLERMSFYQYVSKSGRIRIVDYREDVSHAITELLDANVWLDAATGRWWNCVFFDCNGHLNYDPSYDVLSISDNSDVPFKTLLDGVLTIFTSLFQTSNKAPLFICGELCQSPLIRYVLQQMTGFPVMVLSQQEKDLSFNENEVAAIPEEKLSQLSINSGTPISFRQMTSKPVAITFPISSLDSELTSDVPWKSLISDNSIDYSVGEMGFKMVRLFVEYDSFQNVFLSSNDTRGNRKVIRY